MLKNIDLNSIRTHSGNIAIVGHGNADFDAMVSGILLERVLRKLNIEAYFCVPDGYHDEFFVAKARELGFDYVANSSLDEDAVLFLVDHTAVYPNQVIGCFDHHPQLAEIPCNYVNQPQTCCAKIIYDWATDLGVKIPDTLTKLVVYACHMDSLSFKSTKALPEDRIWCREVMARFNMSEQEVINFGYGVTNRNQDYHDYLMTGLKIYALGDKKIKSSYAVTVDNLDDLEKAAETLRQELTDEIIAWCYLIQNAADDMTHVLLVTRDFHLVQTVNCILSRGKDVIPKVMEFLSAKNDGSITQKLINNGLQIATMESCTSGLIASNITDYEGASVVLKGSYITYANHTKIMAGVPDYIIDNYGVYSPETANAMADVAREKFDANIGIGITGSMGNVDPANIDSVAGEIYYQILFKGSESSIKLVYHTMGISRKTMKQKTVDIVLATLNTMI